jgi:hypothetical protein
LAITREFLLSFGMLVMSKIVNNITSYLCCDINAAVGWIGLIRSQCWFDGVLGRSVTIRSGVGTPKDSGVVSLSTTDVGVAGVSVSFSSWARAL